MTIKLNGKIHDSTDYCAYSFFVTEAIEAILTYAYAEDSWSVVEYKNGKGYRCECKIPTFAFISKIPDEKMPLFTK